MSPLPRVQAGQTINPVTIDPVAATSEVRLPVLKIKGITVTRDLPASVTDPGTRTSPVKPSGQTLTRPTLDVPAYTLDYPVIDAPTQEEFDAAVNANNRNSRNDSGDETTKARELSNKIPTPAILQQVIRPLPQLQLDGRGLGIVPAAPVAPKAPQPTAQQSEGASVTLPLLGTMPLPSKESVALATTTAVAATFVAVLGKAAIEASLEGFRPALRILLIRYKKLRSKELSDQERQLEFAFHLEKKHKAKRTFRQGLADLRDYFRENFLEDLIGS